MCIRDSFQPKRHNPSARDVNPILREQVSNLGELLCGYIVLRRGLPGDPPGLAGVQTHLNARALRVFSLERLVLPTKVRRATAHTCAKREPCGHEAPSMMSPR